MPSLIYVADPMCSWCYGFVPELVTLLRGLPGMPLEIVVGGLHAYYKGPMDAGLKTTLLSHWKHVEKTTGLPFTYDALQDGFVYDTEPACRTVVTTRMLAPSEVLNVFHAIQHAFYAEGKDITRGEVLAQVASFTLTNAGFSIDAASFQNKWTADEMIATTADDFGQSRRWGISSFPALILERDGKLDLVASGYMRTDALVERMQTIVDKET